MKSVKQTILLITIASVIYSCNNNSTREKTVTELKQELKVREAIDFKSYLSITASLRENITQKPDLFHHTKTDGYILEGTVRNSSTLAKFKDLVVTVKYFSETQSVIDSKEYIMYKYFNPTSETPYEYKIYPPPGFKNFSVQINNAMPVE